MSLREYLGKMRGATRDGARRVSRAEVLWSWLGAFLGIGAVSLVSQMYFGPGDMTLVIGSFGAAAVLVYGAIESPLAQPRNLLGGHVISAAVGVTVPTTWEGHTSSGIVSPGARSVHHSSAHVPARTS